MTTIEVENIVKTFRSGEGETVTAVNDLSFSIEHGTLFTLLGPSGCGKTTTLRCLAGFERLDEGRIVINGEPVSDPTSGRFDPPERRDIGFVFQSYAVWPHMTVRENLLFALKNRDYPKEDRNDQIRWVLELVGLPDIEDRYPSELSGGQQQRVAVARAIVYEPSLLLMDEPLSNLDFQQRKKFRQELLEILENVDTTTVYVTHDQAEAFEISDEIAVLRQGQKLQQGAPKELYDHPKTPFVASFIGDANVIPVEVVEKLSNRKVVCTPTDVGTDIEFHSGYESEDAFADPVMVIRPEHIQLQPMDADGGGGTDDRSGEVGKSLTQETRQNEFVGTVTKQLYRGGMILHEVRIGGITLTGMGSVKIFEEGSEVRVIIPPRHPLLISGDAGD